ncbi:MAG: hypothetical protein ACP6IP_08640 [Candidatus Njordarchaeia archaeon]
MQDFFLMATFLVQSLGILTVNFKPGPSIFLHVVAILYMWLKINRTAEIKQMNQLSFTMIPQYLSISIFYMFLPQIFYINSSLIEKYAIEIIEQ